QLPRSRGPGAERTCPDPPTLSARALPRAVRRGPCFGLSSTNDHVLLTHGPESLLLWLTRCDRNKSIPLRGCDATVEGSRDNGVFLRQGGGPRVQLQGGGSGK